MPPRQLGDYLPHCYLTMIGDAQVQIAVPDTSRIVTHFRNRTEDATPVDGATSTVFHGTWNGTKVAINHFPRKAAPEVGELFSYPLQGLNKDLLSALHTPLTSCT